MFCHFCDSYLINTHFLLHRSRQTHGSSFLLHPWFFASLWKEWRFVFLVGDIWHGNNGSSCDVCVDPCRLCRFRWRRVMTTQRVTARSASASPPSRAIRTAATTLFSRTTPGQCTPVQTNLALQTPRQYSHLAVKITLGQSQAMSTCSKV